MLASAMSKKSKGYRVMPIRIYIEGYVMQRNNAGFTVFSTTFTIITVLSLSYIVPSNGMDIALGKEASANETRSAFFHDAVEAGNKDSLQALEVTDINARNEKGDTLLHHAAKNGQIDVVELLLMKGALKDTVTQDGATALHLAAQNGHSNVVEQLIYCDEQVRFHLEHKDYRAAMKVRQDHHALIIAVDTAGFSALHRAAQHGHGDIVGLLLGHNDGALIDAVVQDGSLYTAFHLAAQHGHGEVLVLLLERGALINAHTHNGYTALDLAEESVHRDVVELLLSKGAQRGAVAQAKNFPNNAEWFKDVRYLILNAFSDIKDERMRVEAAKPYIQIAKRDPHQLLGESDFMERLDPLQRSRLSSIFSEYIMYRTVRMATLLRSSLNEEQDGVLIMLDEVLASVDVSKNRNLIIISGGVDPVPVVLETLVKIVCDQHITGVQKRYVQCEIALIQGCIKIEAIYSSYQMVELLSRGRSMDISQEVLGKGFVDQLFKRRIREALLTQKTSDPEHQACYEEFIDLLTDAHLGALPNPLELLNLFNKPRNFVANQCRFIECICSDDRGQVKPRVKIICDLLEGVKACDTLAHTKEFDEFLRLLDHDLLEQLPPKLIKIARYCPHILQTQTKFLTSVSKKMIDNGSILWHYYAALMNALSQYNDDLGQ